MASTLSQMKSITNYDCQMKETKVIIGSPEEIAKKILNADKVLAMSVANDDQLSVAIEIASLQEEMYETLLSNPGMNEFLPDNYELKQVSELVPGVDRAGGSPALKG